MRFFEFLLPANNWRIAPLLADFPPHQSGTGRTS
jgi:hypothetical protein